MTQRPSLPIPPSGSGKRAKAAGLSIIELLIYVALGTVLAAAGAASVIANIRTATNLELRQRAVDDFSRLNLFLQSEVAEGEWLEYKPTLPKDCGPGQPLVAIVLTNPLNPPEPPNARLQEPLPRILYYTRNNGDELWRCGPKFDENGALIITDNGKLSDTVDARVNGNTRMRLINTDDDRTLQYSIELTNRTGKVILQRGADGVPLVAHTGVRAIE